MKIKIKQQELKKLGYKNNNRRKNQNLWENIKINNPNKSISQQEKLLSRIIFKFLIGRTPKISQFF